MALGTAAILGIASAGSAVASGLASKSAAKSQAAAADQADETQRYIFDRNVELTEPQRQIGNNALAALAYESGIGPRPVASSGGAGMSIVESTATSGGGGGEYIPNPSYDGPRGIEPREILSQLGAGTSATSYNVGDKSFSTREEAQAFIDSQPQNSFNYTAVDRPNPNLDFSTAAFEASPGYQFRLDEGNKALERAAAARGMRLSGAALKDAARFGQGIASDEYGQFVGRETDQFNRSYGVMQDQLNALRGLSGQGQQATQAQISAGNTYASGASQNAFARGNAQAQGAIGVGNAFASGVNSMSNIYGMANSGYLGQNPGLGITPVANPFGG